MGSSTRDGSPGEPPESSLWTAMDVARYLKVSRSWVYHRAEAGLLPSLRVGNFLRFDPAAVRAFARKQSRQGAQVLSFRPRGVPKTNEPGSNDPQE
jgi:excisionase family DNA binding protein